MRNNQINRGRSTPFQTIEDVCTMDADMPPVTSFSETKAFDKERGLALQVKNLKIVMDGKENNPSLVHQVNLNLTPGRPLTLIGESGCGKSLIAQAIFHLLPQQLSAEGEIYYGNRDLLACSTSTMRRLWGREIFLFPQEPGTALNPLRRSCSQVTEIFRWVRNGRHKNGNNGDVVSPPHRLSQSLENIFQKSRALHQRW